MKLLKRLLLIVVVLVAILAIVSQFLPGSYRVERSTVIRAAPETIFAKVATPKLWPTWTAWNPERFADMKQTFSGPESGIGAKSEWEGKSSGQGTFTIVEADPARGVVFDLVMEHGQFRSKGEIAFAPGADGVKVTWSDTGELDRNPMHRIFGLFMEKFMGPDFEAGLAKLKTQLETPKP